MCRWSSCWLRGRAQLAAVVLLALGTAGTATAEQFALSGNERLNVFGAALPGSPFNTNNGQVDYDGILSGDAHPGEVHVSGEIPTLNYHTTGAPGVNVAENFALGDPTYMLEGAIANITVTPIPFGTFVQVDFEFGTANPGASWDLTVIDPWDATTLLEADLTPGLFTPPAGLPTLVAGLTASFVVDTTNVDKNATGSLQAFFVVNPLSPYATLFSDGLGMFEAPIALGSVFNIAVDSPDDADGPCPVVGCDFDDVYAALVGLPNPLGNEQLISNVAEAQGQVFATAGFVVGETPEPATWSLLALGLAGMMAAARARRRH